MPEEQYEWMKVTAWLLLEGLGTGFYRDSGDCLNELVKNGEVASMPKGWDPKLPRVEIFFEKNSVLSLTGDKALVVLDHGNGFTNGDFQRFMKLGPSLDDESAQTGKGTHGGAAQKRIGRLAGLASSSYCANLDLSLHERAQHGFYIFTRTAPEGHVRKISFIPKQIEEIGLNLNHQISPNSKELGALKGIKGSFSAIVIPDPIVDTEDEIREALKWKRPRKQDLCSNVTVGGKPIKIPALIRNSRYITHTTKSGIECYIQLAEKEAGANERGIWICDAKTGFRVACCTDLNDKNFVFPMFLPSLTGDIFVPDVLHRQNSARSGLHPAFANKKNRDWRKICMELLEVSPMVQELIGGDDQFDEKEGSSRTLAEVIEQIKGAWGAPDPQPNPGGGGHGGGGGGGGGGNSGGKGYSIKIGNLSYKVRPLHLDENILAEIYKEVPNTICVNIKGYTSMPKNAARRAEHILCGLLEAVGRDLHNESPRDVSKFVAERRREIGDIA